MGIGFITPRRSLSFEAKIAKTMRPPSIQPPPMNNVNLAPARINQRAPEVSLTVPKAEPVTPYTLPTIFATKPFKIAESATKVHSPILTKYSNPNINYQSKYNTMRAQNRNLSTKLNKIQSELISQQKEYARREAAWLKEKKRYKSSPFYVVDRVASDITKRQAQAAKLFSPSVNGIQSLGGAGETVSRAGAGLIALILIGLFIGRVE